MPFLMRCHVNRDRRSIVTSIMPAAGQGCIAGMHRGTLPQARRPTAKTCPPGAGFASAHRRHRARPGSRLDADAIAAARGQTIVQTILENQEMSERENILGRIREALKA